MGMSGVESDGLDERQSGEDILLAKELVEIL